VKLFLDSSFVNFGSICLLLILIFCGEVAAEARADAQPENLPIADVRISIKDFYGEEAYWADMVQTQVSSCIQKGDRFSNADIHRLAAALKACRRFRLIHLDTETMVDGLALIIEVTPFRLIKDIRIHGKYPLFEKQILKAMTLYPGDAYIEEEVDKQPRLIAGLYRQYGYVDPMVKIEKSWDSQGSHYVLDVRIEKGRPYRLARFDIQGNQAFPDAELRWKMKSVRSVNKKFSEKKFLEDLEKLKAYYLARRFADIAITHRLSQDPKTGDVDILITVDEGERYDVSFEGNTVFGDRTLKKDLVIYKSGNRRGTGLRKSTRNILERYRKAGFQEIVVKTETEMTQEENIAVRKLHFVVDEGPRSIVRKIMISDNTVFTMEQLQKQMLTRLSGWLHDGEYIPEKLEEDILAIINLYHAKGYLEAFVDKTAVFSADRKSVEISLKIHEGIQTRVSRITLEGLTVLPPAKVLNAIQIQAGRAFNPSALNNDEKRIAMLVSEKGYPYVQVSGDAVFNEDRSQAQVVFQVSQNRYIKRGKTFYAGNFRTKEKILDRELIVRPGDPFSLKKMLQGQQNIRSMNIFRSVTFNPVGLKEEADAIHLFTEVEEEKPFFIETTGGYESDKGLYATSTLGDHNFFGLNKDFRIGGEISETGYRGESRLFEPRFLGTRISSDSGVFVEHSEPFNQSFGTDSHGADQVFSRKWKKRIKGGLGFHYEMRDQFSRDPDSVDDKAFDERRMLTMTPSISYDNRDNFLNPKKGAFMRCWVDLSRGIDNTLDDFFKYRIDLRGYTTPVRRLTIAGRGGFGAIEPYGSNGEIPKDQLFYLGGTSSVRGFDENLFLMDANDDPVGGRLMAVGNAETRIELGLNFELSLFCDVGYLNKTYLRSPMSSVRYSTGIGLRYATPVGAVGLVYGHKLNPEPDEGAGRLHFSIGYTF
jgi:outer membrane protein insertion porin family